MSRKFYMVVCLLFAVSLIASCGGNSGSGSQDKPEFDNNSAENYISKYETPWRSFLSSENYSGYIAVMFKEGSGVRLESDKLSISKSVGQFSQGDANTIDRFIELQGGAIERGMDIDEDSMEKALERARQEGKKLHDWNLFYKIKVKSSGHAEELFYLLSQSDMVQWVYPMPVSELMGTVVRGNDISNNSTSMEKDASGGPTPDLTSEQTYLDTESATGGLNVFAAWNEGIFGQGVRIDDQEFNWNFDHEDLPIDLDDLTNNPTLTPEELELVNSPSSINHGTAVVGILAALDNGYGITGLAHGSTILPSISTTNVLSAATGILHYLNNAPNQYDPILRPGDIVLLETGRVHPRNTPPTGCALNFETHEPTYCIPPEAYPLSYSIIEDMTELGIIVVEGAGNGVVDLGDPMAKLNDCGSDACPDLSVDDSGAIMVAASKSGHDHTKPWWSNWGTRINAYAWGENVVTTGYGYHPGSDPADQNKWYTQYFDGTSSASALVAGAVALVQNYAKEFYKTIIPHKNVYLDSWQMRELINMAGTAGDQSYNIGRKPDVGAMMNLVAEGAVLPHVAPDTDLLLPTHYAAAGNNYDIDDDGRADLISWTPATPNSTHGVWKIDLSSVAPDVSDPNPDNYGAWDLQFDIDNMLDATGIMYPVVHDYDSDGDADLALYDSKNGVYYIKYMTPAVIASAGEAISVTHLDWDLKIDYSTSPAWRELARPMPGDYNGDNYLDIGVVRGDGHWLVDYGGIGHIEKVGSNIEYVTDFGDFEEDVKYLTDEQLAEAPGWAYQVGILFNTGPVSFYRVPDGLVDAGKLHNIYGWDFLGNLLPIYGENDDFLVVIVYDDTSFLSIKGNDGTWNVTDNSWEDFYFYEPNSGYGGSDCQPFYGFFDNDVGIDRAVKCGSDWRLEFTSIAELRTVTQVDDSKSLPPTVYSGGMKYQKIKMLLENAGLWIEYQDKDPFAPHTIQCIEKWRQRVQDCVAK